MTVISGVLTAPDGSALPSVSINLKALATSSAVVAQLESETVTDASGNYSISAEVGQYQVTISAYGQPDKLVGNIQIFADSVNGTLNDFLTTPGEDALTPVIVATVESMRLAAQTAATDALAARDAAQGYAIHAEAVSEGGATYASTTAGLAATTSGQYFRVPQGTGATSSFIYYLNNAGSALAVADAVGKAAVDAVAAIIPVVQSAPGIVHAFADENGNTALAILSNGLAKVASMMFGYSVKIIGGLNSYQLVKDSDSSVIATYYDDGSVLQNGVFSYYNDSSKISDILRSWSDKSGNTALALMSNGLLRAASMMFGYSVKIIGGLNSYQLVKDSDSSVIATYYDDGSVLQNGVFSYYNDSSKISDILRSWSDKSGNTALALMSNGLLRAASMMFGNSMKIVGGTNYLSFVKNADNSSVATFFDDGSYQIGNVYTYFNNDSTLDGINYIEADKNGNANYVLYDNGEILTTATSDITTPTGTNPLVYENSNNIYLIQNGSAITQLTNDSFANLNPVVIENGDGTFYIRFASQQKGSSFVAARMSGDAHNRMDDNKGILIHDFTTGQSLSVAGTTIAQAPITLSAQYPYDAFSFNGGPKYDQASSSISLSPDDMLYLVPIAENIGVDPSGESECSGASAKLYEKTGNTVLASATGASGFLLANISYGTLTFTDTCLTLQRGYEIAKSLGMKYQPIMTLIHGNQDASAGTSIATYKLEMQKLRTDYESYLQTLMSDSTFSLMCFVQQFSNAAAQAGATGATIAVTIAQAQYEVCRDNANFIMSSTQYARNYIDANHLKSKSYRTDGEVGGSVKAAWLNDGTILTLRPDETNIVQTDSTITIPLLGGVSPIVIDAGRVVDPGNYGFSATGSTISAVAISGSSIVITKSGTATDVSYAYYGSRAAAPGPQTGSRGCIRDSCPDVSPISGENLYNDLIVFIHTF